MLPAGVTLPIAPAWKTSPPPVNQRLPSGPAVMPPLAPLPDGRAYSVRTPDGVILPIIAALSSVNQRLPSDPAVMPATPSFSALCGGTANSVKAPARVILPTAVLPQSANQMLPSGPAVMP